MKIKNKFVTRSKYWKYKYLKINNNLSLLIKIKNIIENIFRVKILKKKNFEVLREFYAYPISRNILKIRNNKLAKILKKFLMKLNILKSEVYLIKLIKKHDKLFFKFNPVKNNIGGMGYNNSLYLFVYLSVQKKIDMFVESGIWKGYTSFLIDNAFKKHNKNTAHYKFDINLGNIIYFSKKAKYFESDLTEYNFQEKKKNSIFLFDDHVSHYERLQYCHENEIKQIIFDDDVDYETVHSDGWPPIPTISMILSKKKVKKFSWVNSDGLASAIYDLKKINNNILKKYLISHTINISHVTGYNNQSRMTFLKKK